MMIQQKTIFWALLLLSLELFSHVVAITILPPRLSTKQKVVRVKEGQINVVLECNLDVGDEPVAYRWLKHHKLVTADLGFAYRAYRKVHLGLHAITLSHQGIYECEAANDVAVDGVKIEVIVEPGDYASNFKNRAELPDTSEVLIDLAASLNDELAEGNCDCDIMFLLHASPDAPDETLSVQANFVNIVAEPIISEKLRISALTYSDYVNSQISFGFGTNKCALQEGLKELNHERWSTRIQPVLRDASKRFKKSKKDCKILFLPIFGSLGTEGVQEIVTDRLKKSGIKIFVMEVTDEPVPNALNMASQRGDGKQYHWWIPLKIWPTIISYMSYMPEELTGCAAKPQDVPGVCVSVGQNCSQSSQCEGIGNGCFQGQCEPLQCNINPELPGCCMEKGDFWCGDVSLSCKSKDVLCDGKLQCMNGLDEDRCWQMAAPCAKGKARCQSSTLCLSMFDLCDGEPQCPGAEDEDPNFCKSFPCPVERPFRCGSGKCIKTDRLCDGTFRDCDDGEDENLEYCSEKHVCSKNRPFKCDYGICMEDSLVCDGVYNCLDALDERLCAQRNCPAERPFKCGNGKCVDLSLVCNGVVDACSDGLDEKNCTNFVCPSSRSFKCDSGRCIDKWLRCDKRDDCGDNSDEKYCFGIPPASTTPTADIEATTPKPATPFPKPTKESCMDDEFYCTSGACLSRSKVCDGRHNCIDGEDEDEDMCNNLPCPETRSYRCPDGACVKVSFCDGIQDCSDGFDEEDCEYDYNLDHGSDGKDAAEDEIMTVFEEKEYNRKPEVPEPTEEIEEEDQGTVPEDVRKAASKDKIHSSSNNLIFRPSSQILVISISLHFIYLFSKYFR